MQIAINSEKNLLQKRKLYVKFIVFLMVLLLLAFNVGSWFFFQKIAVHLEETLGLRILSMAALAAHNIEITPGLSIDDMTFLSDPNSDDFLIIQSKLRSLQTRYELERAYVIDTQSRVLIDGSGNFPIGTKLTYIDQDSAAIFQAWSGTVAASPIHLIEHNRFKSAYAPITNLFGEVIALLVLEANAEFFSLITIFKRGLIIGGLASLGAIILFSVFLSWTIGLLINTQESLRKTEKLAMLGQMAASVAHEIRNPLGIIKATADVVKLKYENREQPDELFDYIGAEVNRLNNLVNDFLSFARETKLDSTPGDILKIIKKTVSAFERECQSNNITISVQSKFQIPPIKFDEDKIHQVLYNLLANASQAMENGGEITIDVDRFFVKGKSFVQILVSDSGKGIEGDVEKIFEPFYTTKSSGSGLGLAITKQIIEKHNGQIDVVSEKNKGTTIKFYLPI